MGLSRKLCFLAVIGALVSDPAAGAKTCDPAAAVRIEVVRTFRADSAFGDKGMVAGRFPVRAVPLGLRSLAQRMLEYAGRCEGAGGTPDGGALLTIEIEVLALGQLYDYAEGTQRHRRLRFVGARVDGVVRLDTPGQRSCAVPFAGEVPLVPRIPVRFGRDLREDPEFAPYAEALMQPGSFPTALAAAVAAVHGRAALAAATADEALAAGAREALARTDAAGGDSAALCMHDAP